MKELTAADAIRTRRSIRKYKNEPVTEEQIKLLLEAAMMAPSACNSRPWEFIVLRSRDLLTKLAAAHPYAKMLNTAPLAIIVCSISELQEGISSDYFPQDCAAATQNILIQATALGLGTCWCGVYPKEQNINMVRKVLNISEKSIPFNIIAVGLPDSSPDARGFYDESRVRYL